MDQKDFQDKKDIAKEILSSIQEAPKLEDIKKKKIEKLEIKVIEKFYTKINEMCNTIATKYTTKEISYIYYNNTVCDDDLIKKIFFDNITNHKKTLSKELNKKGYDINFEDCSNSEFKEKYYKNYCFLQKIEITIKI